MAPRRTLAGLLIVCVFATGSYDRGGAIAVRAFREHELRRFWPGLWRRWAIAVVFALAAAAAGGAGYGWGSRAHETELASLRLRVEMLDAIAQRVLKMTPAERRQFDGLMKDQPRPNLR